VTAAATPPCTIAVHDNNVRRIVPGTPDMNDPNLESKDNILKESQRVRVQIVNVNRA
jgi:pyrimidine deaminase RibD-like protein